MNKNNDRYYFMQESVSNIDNQSGDSVSDSASCNQSDSVSPAKDFKFPRWIYENLSSNQETREIHLEARKARHLRALKLGFKDVEEMIKSEYERI